MVTPANPAAQEALHYKEGGNRYFKAGNYEAAAGLYTQAILVQPDNPILYTNRAMANLKLSRWETIISDCERALELAPSTLKAHYYLSQALLHIGDVDGALSSAETAYALCIANEDKSTTTVGAHVLTCKKKSWDEREKRRVRETGPLEQEVLEGMEKNRDAEVAQCEGAEEKKEIEQMWEDKISLLKEVFEKSRKDEERTRKVPDWAIDDISFAYMIDPVVTKTGRSYERASIMDHLKRNQNDPLTREPLTVDDLRPNLGLKEACEEFLAKNGWAADW